MTLLQPTDVPSRTGINNAITTEIEDHASTTDVNGQHYDSGWISLPLGTNIVASGETPQYRRLGKIVQLRGRLDLSTGSFPSPGPTVVATLPTGFRPSSLSMWALAGTTPATSGRFWVATNGQVNVSPAAAVADAVSVACSFMID